MTSPTRCLRRAEGAGQLHGSRGMAIISGRRCPLYDRLYPDWTRVERSARRNGRGSAIESLWLSPAAAARAPLLSLPETLGLAAPAGAAPPRDA